MQITVSNIPIEVNRKNIKNLHLSVLPPDGKVRVSSPMHLSDESIIMFVRTKLSWIRKQQNKFQNQSRQTERQYISGETMYVFGKQYFLRVEYSYKGNSLELSGNNAILTVRKESTSKQRENYVNEWYRGLLKEKIQVYLPKLEKITGLYCDSWQTKYMTTKWGTCNTNTKKLWFNLQLAKKPLECLEYVILHELAHLKVKNHDEDFVAILDEYMPNWKERKQILNSCALDYFEPKDTFLDE
ncbi:M48 family metallopeptidase [Huintestinicola sp.]